VRDRRQDADVEFALGVDRVARQAAFDRQESLSPQNGRVP